MAHTPVAGYREQPQHKLDDVNHTKAMEERVLRWLDRLMEEASTNREDGVDLRWLSIGRTHIEQGFMAVNRAIMKPNRIRLPEDAPPENGEA